MVYIASWVIILGTFSHLLVPGTKRINHWSLNTHILQTTQILHNLSSKVTYTTYIWIIEWLYRAIWGNIGGTTARVHSQGYPTFPFEIIILSGHIKMLPLDGKENQPRRINYVEQFLGVFCLYGWSNLYIPPPPNVPTYPPPRNKGLIKGLLILGFV